LFVDNNNIFLTYRMLINDNYNSLQPISQQQLNY